MLADRYIFTALARAQVRGLDRQWNRNLYGFAIAPHLVFYLRVDVDTLARRVLEGGGMDYWESGMDLKAFAGGGGNVTIDAGRDIFHSGAAGTEGFATTKAFRRVPSSGRISRTDTIRR